MPIEISASFAFELDQPGDVLLQFEAAAIPEQRILSCDTQLGAYEHCARVPAMDAIGERIWLRADGRVEVSYEARVEPQRLLPDIASLKQVDPHDLPGEAVEYLFDSRFCPAERFQPFVHGKFGDRSGGALIAAMRDWVAERFTYRPGASGPDTDAADSFIAREGICRDYAHVLVALARASAIPARYVACYAPGVEPPDFHAVAEVFLDDPETEGGGAWHLVDGTGMADPAATVKIGVGRDAADVSFLTSFSPHRFCGSSVAIKRSEA